jgi:hypothetical protein
MRYAGTLDSGAYKESAPLFEKTPLSPEPIAPPIPADLEGRIRFGRRCGRWFLRRLVRTSAGRECYAESCLGTWNSRASSGGETRILRATHGPAHPLYTKMVARSLQLWQEYEQRQNLKLFFWSGALRMAGADDSYESAALPVLEDGGIRFGWLSCSFDR